MVTITFPTQTAEAHPEYLPVLESLLNHGATWGNRGNARTVLHISDAGWDAHRDERPTFSAASIPGSVVAIR